MPGVGAVYVPAAGVPSFTRSPWVLVALVGLDAAAAPAAISSVCTCICWAMVVEYSVLAVAVIVSRA